MFGASKNTVKTPTNILSERLTGVERAKLERANEPRPLTVEDVLSNSSAADAPAELKVTGQKRGVQMADKPKVEPQDAAHLYIGAGIRLKGEISGCDMMRVEGVFEGIAQSRQLVLCPGGAFLGTAHIEEAEVEGTFDGTLHVRGRLFLRNKGHIKGQFSYGQLEIERGGQIDGQITPFEKPRAEAPKPPEAARTAEAPRPVAAAPAAPSIPKPPPPPRPLAPAAVSRPPAAQTINGGGVNAPQPLNGALPGPAPAE